MSIAILRGICWFILLSLFAMFALKIGQVVFMANGGISVARIGKTQDKKIYISPSVPPPGEDKIMDYSQLAFADKGGVGILERIDDLSFWNTCAALLATVFIYWAAFKMYEADKNLLAEAMLWSDWNVLLYFAIVAVTLAAYILGVRSDSMSEVAGTFYAHNNISHIKDIQVVEGLLNVILVSIVYIPAITGFRLVKHYLSARLREPNQQNAPLKAVEFIVNSGTLPVLLSLTGFIGTVALFKNRGVTKQNYQVVDWPDSFATMIFGSVLWCGPYIALAIYCYVVFRDVVVFEFLSPLKKFVWLSVKPRPQPTPNGN